MAEGHCARRRAVLNMLLLGPVMALFNDLDRLLYLGPLHDVPPREFQADEDSGPSRTATGLAAWDELHATRDRGRQSLALRRISTRHGLRPAVGERLSRSSSNATLV